MSEEIQKELYIIFLLEDDETKYTTDREKALEYSTNDLILVVDVVKKVTIINQEEYPIESLD